MSAQIKEIAKPNIYALQKSKPRATNFVSFIKDANLGYLRQKTIAYYLIYIFTYN